MIKSSPNNSYLTRYLECFKTPSEEENIILLQKIYENEPNSRWEFVCRNWRYIIYVIRKKYSYPVDEDTISDGLVGLYNATKYVTKQSLILPKFNDYAAKCIYTQLRKGYNYRQQQPTISNSTKTRHKFKILIHQHSLDQKIRLLNGDGDLYLKDRLTDPLHMNPSEYFQDNDSKNFCIQLVKKFKRIKMTEKQLQIFKSLIKNGGCLTSTAKECNLPKQRVHFVKNELVKKFNNYLKKYYPKIQKEMLDIVNNKC